MQQNTTSNSTVSIGLSLPNMINTQSINTPQNIDSGVNDSNANGCNETHDLAHTQSADLSLSPGTSNSHNNDVKMPLQNVTLDPNEVSAFDDIFDDSIESSDQEENTEDSRERVIISPGGTLKMRQVIDDDCEMSYGLGKNMFQPAEMGIQVKLNDEFSGNIPFKENVRVWFIIFSIKY